LALLNGLTTVENLQHIKRPPSPGRETGLFVWWDEVAEVQLECNVRVMNHHIPDLIVCRPGMALVDAASPMVRLDRGIPTSRALPAALLPVDLSG
jgi:hypothetical protein